MTTTMLEKHVEKKQSMSLYSSGSMKMSMATLDKYTHEYISSYTKITHQTRLDIKATFLTKHFKDKPAWIMHWVVIH